MAAKKSITWPINLNYSSSKIAVLKKQFLAASAKIRHKMARNPFLYGIL
jgi:hypothetical protein